MKMRVAQNSRWGGSCIGGTAFGGSAAVVWRGDPEDGEIVKYLRSQGRRWTCSFDIEIVALGLAASYIADLKPGPDVLICSDCASPIDALSCATADKRPAVRDAFKDLQKTARKTDWDHSCLFFQTDQCLHYCTRGDSHSPEQQLQQKNCQMPDHKRYQSLFHLSQNWCRKFLEMPPSWKV